MKFFALVLMVNFWLIMDTVDMVKTQRKGRRHKKQSRSDELKCGIAVGTLSDRIVGGYDVGYYKFPWFVSLYKYKMPYCGGTLVGKRTAITAAHCFQGYVDSGSTNGIENEYDLKMGMYNICKTDEPHVKTFKAQKVIIHEKYKKEDPFFDIALLQLEEDVDYLPACLPTKPIESSQKPKEGFIAGYGVEKYQQSKTSCVMREARVRIFSDKVCKKMLHKADPEVDNFANAFCAGYLEGGIDACQGDSGGPLFVLESESRYALLGVTSFGYKCAAKDLLGVYTDVSKYLDWIKEHSSDEQNGDEDGEEDSDEDEDENSDEDEDENSDEDDEGDDDDDDEDDDGEKKKHQKNKHKKKLHGIRNEPKGNKRLRSFITRPVFELKKENLKLKSKLGRVVTKGIKHKKY